MDFDVFFSISQTPVDGVIPSEATMFRNFFDQVEAADALGYGTAWVAESHLSSEVQKRHKRPVIPHWQGEVGLNGDIIQLATHVFARTKRIEVGAAVMNVLVNGGPVAHAERVATWATLHGLNPAEKRRLNIGFATGRFDFMAAAFGFVPRSPLEAATWPIVKARILEEAGEIFVRLLRGDVLSSDDVTAPALTRSHFRSDADWQAAQALAGTTADTIPLDRRFVFDVLEIVPRAWRRELVQLVVGTHEPAIQERLNQWGPVQVFNLSITQPAVIEDTHRRMAAAYHPTGGPWKRSYMPRTTFVFVDDTPGLTPDSQRAAAHAAANKALGAYWSALEGTIDPKKVSNAADNALIGNVDDITRQMEERFHPDDRLMLWFDFFDHDSPRVIERMAAFQHKIGPRLGGPR